ncbi:hypothetical protein [Pseudaestuariivita atlantica]|uniref:Uncharacterized protein n=1 Tax=Pseudaestuariivita atlantica TaxID=1317121 RepID=A0A0L1JQ56_9RHOB|nr:hypothetical protein [Pseudaestuariivita atlantica]KNG93523.1 hypothetical protein ATO11_09895 [Pseudaestuariivita atlantica]
MTSLAATFGTSFADHPMRKAFLRWQCRVRQIAMRDNDGRPDDAIMPAVFRDGEDAPMGHIITVMSKAPGYSVTPELKHMAAKTNDPAQRRQTAVQFLSSSYYQKASEFTDILTATFPPASPGAAALREAASVRLRFEAYAQMFELRSKVWRLAEHNPLWQATMAHNALFNPALPSDSVVLAFEPDWEASTSEPEIR